MKNRGARKKEKNQKPDTHEDGHEAGGYVKMVMGSTKWKRRYGENRMNQEGTNHKIITGEDSWEYSSKYGRNQEDEQTTYEDGRAAKEEDFLEDSIIF